MNYLMTLTAMLLIYLISPVFAQTNGELSPETINAVKYLIIIGIGWWCYSTRKKAIGGWLLFYFISLFLSTLISIPIILMSLPSYSPAIWDDLLIYTFFLITTLPTYFLTIAQIVASVMILSVRFRDWKYVNYLRIVLLGQILFALIALPIDFFYFPDSIGLEIFGAIPSIIWLTYFSVSKRVRSVYLTKDWKEE